MHSTELKFSLAWCLSSCVPRSVSDFSSLLSHRGILRSPACLALALSLSRLCSDCSRCHSNALPVSRPCPIVHLSVHGSRLSTFIVGDQVDALRATSSCPSSDSNSSSVSLRSRLFDYHVQILKLAHKEKRTAILTSFKQAFQRPSARG